MAGRRLIMESPEEIDYIRLNPSILVKHNQRRNLKNPRMLGIIQCQHNPRIIKHIGRKNNYLKHL